MERTGGAYAGGGAPGGAPGSGPGGAGGGGAGADESSRGEDAGGAGTRSQAADAPNTPAPVTLHVYDLGTGSLQLLNGVLRPFGIVAFHCGVEVHDWEWSYSDTSLLSDPNMTGVFCTRPRTCKGHNYSESVHLGVTAMTEREMMRVITLLEKKWPGGDYNILTRNCGHFCNELCRMLGVNAVPPWITQLAGTGAKLVNAADKHCCVGPPVCCWWCAGKGGAVQSIVNSSCVEVEVGKCVVALPILARRFGDPEV